MVWVSTKGFLVSFDPGCVDSQHSSNCLISVNAALQIKHSAIFLLLSSSDRDFRRILNHSPPFLSVLHPGKDMGHRITKKCSADCPETNVNFGVAAYSTKCCSTSLCNFSGANSIKMSYTMMFLGVVASLICVIKAGLWWGVGEDGTAQEPTSYSPSEKTTSSVKCLQQVLRYLGFSKALLQVPSTKWHGSVAPVFSPVSFAVLY